ncbi:hypothetical protein ACFQFH_19555 [Halobaculum halobium]|uniref:hypothetical protein n=1 Tax=Halobaculum halobium TaxID=3032281 RepID=UPI003618EE8B
MSPTAPGSIGGASLAAAPLQTVADALDLVNAPRLAGFAVASFLVATVAAAAYRWFVSEPVPRGLTTLLGTAVVAVYLNTVGLFSTVIPVGGSRPPTRSRRWPCCETSSVSSSPPEPRPSGDAWATGSRRT